MLPSIKLYEEFIEMLETGEQTDCVFQLKNVSPSSKEINESQQEYCLVRAHKLILSAASPVLKAMLSKEWNCEKKPIEIKDDDAEMFKIYIK